MNSIRQILLLLLTMSALGCGEKQMTHESAIKPTASQSAEEFIRDLVANMTLAEKVGQMTQAERKTVTPGDIKAYFIGSILNGGGSTPGNNTVEEWRAMIDGFQRAALSTRLGIPMIYGTDAVHGHNNVKGATIFPHNIGLGAMRNPELMEQIGRITALEVTATGVHWNFAPALCVARDIRWGRAYECYGEHPEIGMSYSGPYVRGIQHSGNVLATAKHWVGDGGTTYGTGDFEYAIDRGDTRISEQQLREIHIAPYLNAFKEKVGSVMFSYNSFNGLKMHAHEKLNNDVLKQELGFDGFVVSDWQAIEEIDGKTNRERVVKSVNAGLDMAMEPQNWKGYIQDLTNAVKAGEVSMERIDNAVTRILRQKYRLGLFTRPMSADRMAQFQGILGKKAHRDVARQAVRESQVVLKNNQVLPLKKGARVFVAGSHADNIGLQSGGWTIAWQGGSGEITPGTSILDGIKQFTTKVTFEPSGEGAEGHDVGIVVVGELPYAEGYGDYGEQPCKYCQPLTLSDAQLETVENVKKANIPLLVILVSGRPLLISDHLKNWDALVAAWLPGSEGKGVADVLFGDFTPQGKLSVTWPRDMQQVDLNVGDEIYSPLFEYGHGLSY